MNTKTSDFGIMTVVGRNAGESVSLEKRGAKTYVIPDPYQPVTNHWDPKGDFGHLPSLPRTLNSQERQSAAVAQTGRKLLVSPHFAHSAIEGVIDSSTRVLIDMNPAAGTIAMATTTGAELTSAIVSARFNGRTLENVQHEQPVYADIGERPFELA